jgi:hypothetical protein
MQHEQECCARALQAAEHHRRQASAARAKDIANEANQRKAAALRQRLRLVLSESVAERDRQREAAARHDGATRAAQSAALALVEDCRRNAARARIQETCKLLAAPLDSILADIEHEDTEEGVQAAQ